MFYQRKIFKQLQAHLEKPQITVITGMRRVGKTTLVKKLLQDCNSHNQIYFDLERLDHRDLFSVRNYQEIITYLKQVGLNVEQKIYLAIDEIQLLPNITSVIKYLYDNYSIKFIATGSSSYYLKNLFTESLAGRKKIFRLDSLDFGEFLKFKEIAYQDRPFKNQQFSKPEFNRLDHHYREYLNYGGFPEVVLASSTQDKEDLLFDILSSYLNFDVQSLANFKNLRVFDNLLKLLATRVGSKIDYSKLASALGLSRPTVQSYLNFLEKTFVIGFVTPFSKSPDREIVKAPKLYFADNGLLSILGDISSGARLENALYNQLRAYGNLNYYTRKTGREIDFILNQQCAFEIKETPNSTDLDKLANLAAKLELGCYRLIGHNSSGSFTDFIYAGAIY
jgi:predicted AAA+ superfamily ATPase